MTTRRLALPAATLALALAAGCGEERTSSGPVCVNGECTAEVYVACFATDEVKGTSRDLVATASFPADDGPIALDFGAGALWASHSLGAPTLLRIAPGVAPVRHALLGGGDLQDVAVKDGLVYTTNSSVSTIAVVDPARGPIDEVRLSPDPGTGVFPQGIEFVGDLAYVALYGSASAPTFEAGQRLAVVRFADEAACTSPPCGQVVKEIPFRDVPGAYDAGGFPFPTRLARVGSRLFVTLSNLKLGAFGFYTDPAGNGRLAVVDTAAGDAVTIVDLGAACTNPGGVAADGATVWVACASGAVVPVNAAAAPPSVGPAVTVPIVPGQLTACRGSVYVTDQFSGQVLRFEPGGAVGAPVEVCPVDGPSGFAWAADVECGP
jgi:hypothetical protein